MEQPVEYHPWEPFVPDGAVVLFVGTFPPARSRWAMDFYYPNRINDFWRIMGLIFKGDKNALLTPDLTGYRLDEIKQLLTERHIALSDTGLAIRRLAGNASDKFLEIVEQRDIPALVATMPDCRFIAPAGIKASEVVAEQTSTEVPKMGATINIKLGDRPITIARMPSTSRAYPMKLEKKADYYRNLFELAAIL